MRIGVVETEEDRGFGVKQGDGSTDLNKSIPPWPADSDLQDENSLHSQYNDLEDSHTPLQGTKVHRLERRPVATKQRRGSKQSNESTPALRTNHREAETVALLDTQEMGTQESDDMDSVAELARAHQSPGNGSSRSCIDGDDSTKATVGACHPQANESNGSRRARESSPDAVERFYYHLNKAKVGYEFEMFWQAMSTPRSLANVEAALQSLIWVYNSVSLHANNLNSTVSQSEKEYKSLKTSHDELGRKIKDLTNEASKVKIDHGKEVSRLEGPISTMQLHFDNLERRYHERTNGGACTKSSIRKGKSGWNIPSSN
jgi:hypothetical protein